MHASVEDSVKRRFGEASVRFVNVFVCAKCVYLNFIGS